MKTSTSTSHDIETLRTRLYHGYMLYSALFFALAVFLWMTEAKEPLTLSLFLGLIVRCIVHLNATKEIIEVHVVALLLLIVVQYLMGLWVGTEFSALIVFVALKVREVAVLEKLRRLKNNQLLSGN